MVDQIIRKVPTLPAAAKPLEAHFVALSGVPLIKAGDDLVAVILNALNASHERLRDGDVLILAQKIVSKAQNRLVPLASITPSVQAQSVAREVNKDPRLVELILRESTEIVRQRSDVLIVAHRLGFVVANAGIDQSNVEHDSADDMALLLPENPDATCAQLRSALKLQTGADVAVIINDSHGRAFRNGTVGVAIGVSGLAALIDLRGKPDLFRRRLRTTEVGHADEIASAASLLMGQSSEGRPIVLARGVPIIDGHGAAAELIRTKTLDLFRLPVAAPQSQSTLEASATDLIRGRRSIRNYLDRPVPDAVLEQILDCATCAPSAHNRQPWRFAVLKDAPGKQRLARMMAERLQADLTRDAVPPEVIRKDAERSIARITGAPIVVVVCLTMDDMDTYHDERRSTAERQMAVQSTAMAMQNLVLAAHAGRLGASIMCAPLFCPDTVKTALELSPHWEPQALVTIGYPASAGKPFKRRPLYEVMRVVDIKP